MAKIIFAAATLLSVALVLVLLALLGDYDVGADSPHSAPLSAFLNLARERSVQRAAERIRVPLLDDPARVHEGAEHYSAMCVDCHLAPGVTTSEIRAGLLPAPPNLAQTVVDPRVAFWTIKHGIKMTAMPAWGKTHDDEEIWNIVAFVQKLPQMTPAGYRSLTESMQTEGHESEPAAHDDDHDHDHEHQHHDHEHHHEHEHANEHAPE